MIGFKTPKQLFEEAKTAMENLSHGKPQSKKSGVFFADLASARRAITSKRLELIKVVKAKNPASVYQLAKLLGRDARNVSHDLAYLEELGLISTHTTKSGRTRTMITANYDAILFEIAV